MNEERVNAEINFETGNIETGNSGSIEYGNPYGGASAGSNGNIPTKVSVWTKLKGFLLQDVSEMKLELTPGEKKFVDFWTQEVTVDKVYDFLFQEIKFK